MATPTGVKIETSVPLAQRKKFKKYCVGKGGMSKVLAAFIKEKTKEVK